MPVTQSWSRAPKSSEAVQASFTKVNQAQQEKEKLISEARRGYNKEAEGDVARFSASVELTCPKGCSLSAG